jgi:hypothetical protein
MASSLVGGYHTAFAIGAASVVVGIVMALTVLRTREPDPAAEAEPVRELPLEPEPQLERQAA